MSIIILNPKSIGLIVRKGLEVNVSKVLDFVKTQSRIVDNSI